MAGLVFEWDSRKAALNQKKHGVSFEEAESAFLDEGARIIDDPDHSEEEDRFILLGFSLPGRCLVVIHCYRESDAVIRIISARRATSAERSRLLEVQMRKEYDFSKSRKSPYANRLKRQITIRLDTAAVDYFKQMATELGMPYQNLINLFLRDCAAQKRRPMIQWIDAPRTKRSA